jgi:hypothetical protein
VVHQVRGEFRHPTPTAAGTERSPLAREGHQAIQAAPRTPKPRKAASQPPAAEEVAELLLDEPRQPFSIAQTRGLRAKGLEMVADHLVQHALLGSSWLVLRRRGTHAVTGAQGMPHGMRRED